MAQQRQDRRGEVQAATASATGLACFIFRFLRRPLHQKEVRRLGASYLSDSGVSWASKTVSPFTAWCNFNRLES
ncbi:hypothetical protein DIN29_25865 [Salmonella enterica]|nr:hypothetical protein [Salmonella enterica subsp. enterica serovar 4,[5],12:i:-]ECV0063775.1 hypothetical protein [Salmonella enterica subsp. enterica serovar 4,[5],12:i:-]